MKYNERIFDQIVSCFGGIYKPTTDTESDRIIQVLIDYIIPDFIAKNVERVGGKPLDVQICCVDNVTVNAFATVKNNEYLIAICKGTITTLRSLLDVLDLKIGKKLVSHRHKHGDIESLAVFLHYSTLQFLGCHEYFHLANGHCELANYLEMGIIEEMTGDTLVNEGLFLQTLEYDADCASVSVVIGAAITRSLNDDLNTLDKKADYVSSAVLGIYFTIRVFWSLSKTSILDFDKSTHPHPSIRLRYCLETVLALLEKFYNAEDANCIMDKIISNILLIEDELGAQNEAFPKILRESYTPLATKHLIKIINNRIDVAEKLKPFSHRKLEVSSKLNERVAFDDELRQILVKQE